MFTRAGFDITRHPLSLLSLGDVGWIQTANFIATGLLALAFAAGLRSCLQGGRGGVWGPFLIGTFGLGMVIAGIFPADPSLGFPPGAPDGMSETLSDSAKLHGVGFFLAFGSLIAAMFVFAWRFFSLGLRRWGLGCVAAGGIIPLIIISGFMIPRIMSLCFALAGVVAFGWVSAFGARQTAEVAVY
jgi:hypothetical protein